MKHIFQHRVLSGTLLKEGPGGIIDEVTYIELGREMAKHGLRIDNVDVHVLYYVEDRRD